MAYSEALSLPRTSLDRWVAPNREALQENFNGMELEKVKQLLETDEGKKKLLAMMKESDPAMAPHVDKMLDVVDRNVEQLEKKESFLKKVLMMPVRTVKAVGNTIRKHPVLSAIGAAGIVALLIYFFGPAAGTVGSFGQGAIDTFSETVLAKVPVPTPEAALAAAAELPGAGGLANPSAVGEAMESLQSTGTLMMQNAQAAEAAGISDGAMQAISSAADGVIANPAAPGVNPVEQFFQSFPSTPNP